MKTAKIRAYGSYQTCFVAGVGGAAVMSVLLILARSIGLTALNIPITLGSIFTMGTGAGTWVLGFIIHLLLGGVFGLAYAAGFRKYQRTGASAGATFGLIHWVAAGIFYGILPMINPAIPEVLIAPGFFAAGFGISGIIGLLTLHLIYGAIVGATDRRLGTQVKLSSTSTEERPPFRRAA